MTNLVEDLSSSNLPQVIATYFKQDKNGNIVGCCALGELYIKACGKENLVGISDHEIGVTLAEKYPQLDLNIKVGLQYQKLSEVISDLNDRGHSRMEISSIVKSLLVTRTYIS